MRVAVQVTPPRNGLINLSQFRAALERGLDDSADAARLDLAKPTATWQTTVAFTVKKMANARAISTTNPIYGYVAKGTRPHAIYPRNARYLNFGPSTPKTAPGSLNAGSGSRGPRTTFVKAVQHPGSAARNFDRLAADNARQAFPERMRRAVQEGSR